MDKQKTYHPKKGSEKLNFDKKDAKRNLFSLGEEVKKRLIEFQKEGKIWHNKD